jgi:hypothetical protein
VAVATQQRAEDPRRFLAEQILERGCVHLRLPASRRP